MKMFLTFFDLKYLERWQISKVMTSIRDIRLLFEWNEYFLTSNSQLLLIEL